jgi:protein-disulfide isomerase
MDDGMSGSIRKMRLTVPAAGRDHVQGPTEAPITLLEYGDYECPYCGEAHPIVKAVQERLGNRLCFAFRHFPLLMVHPRAEHAAESVEAAAAQGKFWQMHDLIFENQDALEDEDLAEYAATLGLDAKRLIGEVRNRAHEERIREDMQTGRRLGVNGTPTFFVNGVPYEGEVEVNALLTALNS